jgi:hypothetical protein
MIASTSYMGQRVSLLYFCMKKSIKHAAYERHSVKNVYNNGHKVWKSRLPATESSTTGNGVTTDGMRPCSRGRVPPKPS